MLVKDSFTAAHNTQHAKQQSVAVTNQTGLLLISHRSQMVYCDRAVVTGVIHVSQGLFLIRGGTASFITSFQTKRVKASAHTYCTSARVCP